MNIKIVKIDDDQYQVNDKTVHRDMNGKWNAPPNISVDEISAFQRVVLHIEKKKLRTK